MATHTTHTKGAGRGKRRAHTQSDSSAREDRGISALALLEMQHRHVEQVFDRMHDSSDDDEIRSALFEVADLLAAHAMLEERLFYPAVRNADTEGLVSDSLHDHDEFKHVLAELLDVDPSHRDFANMVDELEGLVEGHVEEEESELFPRVQGMMTPEDLRELGQELTSLLAHVQQAGPPHLQLIQQLEQQSEGSRS
jgi:hemerythrin superfamily protein